MNRWIPGIAILGIALSPQNGRGAVISHDWKTPGDGLLTYDDVNQREWLDLTQTTLAQFPGANREAKYQYVVNQTDFGGSFQGFSVGARIDVVALATSAGINVTAIDNFTDNATPANALAQLLGITHPSPVAVHSVGLLSEINPPPFAGRLGAHILVSPGSGPAGMAGLAISADDDLLFNPLPGVWLYRPVPEGAGVAQAAILMGILLWYCTSFLRTPRRVSEIKS